MLHPGETNMSASKAKKSAKKSTAIKRGKTLNAVKPLREGPPVETLSLNYTAPKFTYSS
jgi:hypothetical protein